MLSLETEKRIARLLFQTAECERSVERSRQDLCSSPSFDLYSTFRILDIRTNGKVSVSDLKTFLSSCGHSVLRSNIELLIKQYDSNFDENLSLEEFQALVLPSENLELRHEVLNRGIFSVSPYIEKALARHMELECSYQSQLETLKKSLATRPDFTPIDCFRAVNVDHLSMINVYEIRDFLRRNGYSINMQDLEAIVRRIDIDADGNLSYDEFAAWISVSKQERSPKKEKNDSPNKSSPLKNSPLRRSSTKSSTSKSVKSSPNKSPQKSRKKSNSNIRSKLFETVCAEDMQVIVECFNGQVAINNELERQRVELARQADFNLLDFFRIFDLDDRGTVVGSDIESLLHDLRVFFHVDDVYLLVRHYSSYRDSILRISDIERMVVPRDRHWSNVLKSRVGRSVPALDRLRVFSLDTLDIIIKILKLLLISESSFENLRKHLARKKWINLYEVFQDIDQDKDGLISIAELQDIMRRFKSFPSIDELESLIEIYDKDFDRRISYSEFIEEVTPKLYN